MRKLYGLLCLALLCHFASSQTAAAPAALHLVMPTGAGAIELPLDPFKPERMSLYDKGTRPVLQFTNGQDRITLSVILFPNESKSPTAEGCRDDVIGPLRKRFSDQMVPKTFQQGDMTSVTGLHLATASYFLKMLPQELSSVAGDPLDLNAFAFYGDKNICAELHASVAEVKKSEKASIFDELLRNFNVLPDYRATMQDYGQLATLLYETHDYPSAAIYYERALALLPASPPQPTVTRLLTDQLAMSYGMSGDLKKSRAINEAAIAKDPDYPLYYYNLACADAEAKDATAARTHLQQAFERRANTLKGEKLPDPAKDDSFLKLKSDKAFWAFVESLPKA